MILSRRVSANYFPLLTTDSKLKTNLTLLKLVNSLKLSWLPKKRSKKSLKSKLLLDKTLPSPKKTGVKVKIRNLRIVLPKDFKPNS